MSREDPTLDEGLYESVVTHDLDRQLQGLTTLAPDVRKVDDADLPHVLTRHVTAVVEQALTSARSTEQRLTIVNGLLEHLNRVTHQVVAPPSQLLRLAAPSGPGTASMLDIRPATPLTEAALLTNAHGEPNLGGELRAEIDTSNDVDLLCAFVKWHGLRLLEQELRRLRDRGARFRVITTTYMGATERLALDRLVREFGAEIKIQYDAQRTRLHAKAWLFRRDTEFDTAYVGSSNLSRAALLDGVEWNVRLSRVGTPSLLEKFGATFDTYWNDASFETYDPDRDRDRLDDALAEARGHKLHDRVTISLSGLEVRPYPYQSEMLEAIEVERTVHDRHRNLVVAATGTGKTVVAALDYRGLCDAAAGDRPSLLFIAHRKEILEQSLRTYREVLADADFGELYVGGTRPERWKHVFASVQSLTSYGIANMPADAYDVVVIDEFHHAEAATYRRIINHLTPRELLGLTATPERADGTDVRSFFGGRTAAELRLWDALGADLLCPFHYFTVADGTDLRQISWKRGRYDDGELSNVYTGNDRRAAIVLQQLRDKVLDPGSMRALGFCVSVAHAEFMAKRFNEAGIPSLAVSGNTPAADRAHALQDLKELRVNAIFAADLFNEGLDLPDVDTVLFLRPTESATVFLQQLGRGLRRTRTKAVLTVLDFVGYHRKEFRFDQKLRALTGQTRAGARARDQERLSLPALWLPDRHGQAVTDNRAGEHPRTDRQPLAADRRRAALVRRPGPRDLPRGVRGRAFRHPPSWPALVDQTASRRRTRNPRRLVDGRRSCSSAIRAFAHVDDRERGEVYRWLLSDNAPGYGELSQAEQRMARMLFFSLWPDGGGHSSFAEGLAALRRERATRDELSSVVDLSFDAARHHAYELTGALNGRAPAGARALPARGSPRRARLRLAGAQAELVPRGRALRARAQRRRLLRDAEEVRGGLLPHDDVPGLPDQPDALPLGIPVDDIGRVKDRTALRQRDEPRSALREGGTEGRVRHGAVSVLGPGSLCRAQG